MLRPINRLSERIGLNALTRASRLRRQANELESQVGLPHEDGLRVLDMREHADLIDEIHRLSNPDFPQGDRVAQARAEGREAGLREAAEAVSELEGYIKAEFGSSFVCVNDMDYDAIIALIDTPQEGGE